MIDINFSWMLYSAINIVSLYTLNDVIGLFLKDKIYDYYLYKWIPYIIYLIVGLQTYNNKLPYINVITQIILVFILSSNFLLDFKKVIIIAFSWTGLKIIVEMLVSIVYSTLINDTIIYVINKEINNLIASTICSLILLIIVKSLYLLKNKKNVENFSFINSLKVCIMPISSIFILYTFIEFSVYGSANNIILIISVSLIAFLNVFFYSLFDKISQSQKLYYENQLLKNQSKYYIEIEQNLNNTFENVRLIKHELNNHLIELKFNLDKNTPESINDASNKINKLIGEVFVNDFKTYTKNQSINRLLNYKLLNAYKSNINVEVNANIKFNINVDLNDLYIILGNSIDNAIRCFNSSESVLDKIEIVIIDDDNNLLIKISNPYVGKLVFKNELPITTQKNKSIHGIGLQLIKKTVENKNGFFNIKTKDNIFILEISLFDELLK